MKHRKHMLLMTANATFGQEQDTESFGIKQLELIGMLTGTSAHYDWHANRNMIKAKQLPFTQAWRDGT